MMLYAIGNALLLVMLSRMAGPFTFVPAMACFMTAGMMAYPTLGHRIIMSPGAKVKGSSVADVVASCLSRVPVPGARARA